jgi:tetratricopeptide (TPR) repeat protein
MVPLTLLTGLAIVGVIFWIFKRFRRRRLEQHRLVTQAVQHATGDVPAELQQGERRLTWFGSATAAEFIGAFVGYALLRRVWPEAPVWMVPVIGVSIYLAVTILQSLVKREAKPSDPIGPGAPSRYDWGKTGKAVGGVLMLILLFNADRLPMLGFLRGYYFWMLILVPVAYQMLVVGLNNAAARRGDYAGALKIIRYSHFYNPSGMEALRMSGHMLLIAGRYREAENTLRRSLTGSQASESYGTALEYLGDALMEQGRYDEATRSYEAALHAFSFIRRPYRGMAEMLLRQDKNPQQALEYIERIIDFKGLSWRERQSNGKPEDDYLSLKAWALARLGRSSEVAPAIESAIRATDKKTLPDLATTYYRAGMAMQALDNLSSANEHFKKALEFDPLGRRGALAKIALTKGSVFVGVRD